MGGAAVISFGEVRATKQWATLRQPLHIRFDQWRDRLAARLQEPEPTVSAVPETVWHLRQELTGGRTATRGAPAYCGEYPRQQRRCRQCHRCLKARAPVSRTVETMVGAVPLERPYVSCRVCRGGVYPLDEALGVLPGRPQLDVQKAAVQWVTEVP